METVKVRGSEDFSGLSPDINQSIERRQLRRRDRPGHWR
jgi:hypothetical protein